MTGYAMEPANVSMFKGQEMVRMHIRSGTTWSLPVTVVDAVRLEAQKQNIETGKLVAAILWQVLEQK